MSGVDTSHEGVQIIDESAANRIESSVLLLGGWVGREDRSEQRVRSGRESGLEVWVESVIVLVHETIGHVANVAGEMAHDERLQSIAVVE